MSYFAYHYTETMLRNTGWPKRRGLFNSEAVINTFVADVIIENMIDWAASLGACCPKLALQILTCAFKKNDWGNNNALKFSDLIDGAAKNWNPSEGQPPHKIISPFKFSKYGEIIEAKVLNDETVRQGLESTFLDALLWGITNPTVFEHWYKEDSKKKTENLKNLNTGHAPTLNEYISDGEKMIKEYELKMNKLPPVSPSLFEEATKLGVKF